MTPDQSTLDAIASMDAAELSQLLTHLTPAERAEFDAILANVHVPLWKPNPGPQSLAYDSKADELFYGGSAGGGKCLGICTLMPTVEGFKRIDEICVGDQVYGIDGKPCDVIYTSDVMHGHECFELEFDDGSVIIADDQHKWPVVLWEKPTIYTTHDIWDIFADRDHVLIPRAATIPPHGKLSANGTAFHRVVCIRPVPSVPVRCIGVNSPDHLYLIGEACIPTHNTDLILGLALTKHKKSLILRRQATSLPAIMDRLRELVDIHGSIRGSGYGGFCRTQDGRQLELAGCKDEQDKTKYQGRPHDCKLFDEITEFTKTQYTFINTWLRTADPRQRCRIVATGNPPTSSEGEWIIKHWGPWLDEQHPNPAKPTELRWYAMVDGKEQEFMTAAQFIHNGEVIRPRSRTFIPARIEDNPIYMASGYRDVLAALEEPLRSMMLYGDFKVKRTDDVWQVIPRDWVIQAQKRWTPQGKTGTLDCVGVDVGRGSDPSVISRRYGTWFAPLLKYTGEDSDDGPKVAAHVAMAIAENPKVPVNIDVIGLGASPYDSCKQMGMRAFPINFAASSDKKDRAGILRMRNLRAFAYWSMREALDPKKGDCIALPPDPDLLADLTAPKWSLTVGGILIESKDEIKHRLGRSTDSGDAVVMAALPIRYTEFKMERI